MDVYVGIFEKGKGCIKWPLSLIDYGTYMSVWDFSEISYSSSKRLILNLGFEELYSNKYSLPEKEARTKAMRVEDLVEEANNNGTIDLDKLRRIVEGCHLTLV